MTYKTLDLADVSGHTVLVRVDLNVPVHDGAITDLTRIERIAPTLIELSDRGAKVVVLSHFDRPKGKRVPSMSLQPVAAALGHAIGRDVLFCNDCIGTEAETSVRALTPGRILVLENTRFYPGEEANDPDFVDALAKLGDIYVNDAFSAAHRAHASTEGLAHRLPAFAGRAMQRELEALNAALGAPMRPVAAVVGGSKVSTKLDLLNNLSAKVDILVIGGAMANTFLAARGVGVGKSLQEPGLYDTATGIVEAAADHGCKIVLPVDAVVSPKLVQNAPSRVVPITDVPADEMILDVGPATVESILAELKTAKTLVWNGPLGAFEFSPFDAGTTALAQEVAAATTTGALMSIGGGGDTVSALRHAGVLDRMTYVSTAGGAFLEWLEGRTLPGVAALG